MATGTTPFFAVVSIISEKDCRSKIDNKLNSVKDWFYNPPHKLWTFKNSGEIVAPQALISQFSPFG